MKISEGGRGGGVVLFERMDHTQLIQGFSDQTKVVDAHFLVSVVELTPFLSISICWFSLWLLQTKEVEPGSDGVASLKMKKWLS